MVLNFINILLQCISAYIILPHQIHLFNRSIRQIFQNILSESIRHLIKLAWFSSNLLIACSNSIFNRLGYIKELLLSSVQLQYDQKLNNAFHSSFGHNVLFLCSCHHLSNVGATYRWIIKKYHIDTSVEPFHVFLIAIFCFPGKTIQILEHNCVSGLQ